MPVPSLTSSTELDGVSPPPGVEDPTEVVWREYGNRRDRVPVQVLCLAAYAGVAVVVTLATSGHFTSAFSLGFDAVCLVVALVQGWLMTSARPYYAAGASWMIGRSNGLRPDTGQPYPFLRFAALRRVEMRTRTEGWQRSRYRVVHFEDAEQRAWAFRLSALQSCPPMVDLIEPALSRSDVTVEDGVREALHERPEVRGSSVGRTVVRARSAR